MLIASACSSANALHQILSNFPSPSFWLPTYKLVLIIPSSHALRPQKVSKSTSRLALMLFQLPGPLHLYTILHNRAGARNDSSARSNLSHLRDWKEKTLQLVKKLVMSTGSLFTLPYLKGQLRPFTHFPTLPVLTWTNFHIKHST